MIAMVIVDHYDKESILIISTKEVGEQSITNYLSQQLFFQRKTFDIRGLLFLMFNENDLHIDQLLYPKFLL